MAEERTTRRDVSGLNTRVCVMFTSGNPIGWCTVVRQYSTAAYADVTFFVFFLMEKSAFAIIHVLFWFSLTSAFICA